MTFRCKICDRISEPREVPFSKEIKNLNTKQIIKSIFPLCSVCSKELNHSPEQTSLEEKKETHGGV